MVQTVYCEDFINAFDKLGKNNPFSEQSLCKLYDLLLEYEDDCGEDIYLDVDELCIRYAEFTIEELEDYYSNISNAIAEYINVFDMSLKESIEKVFQDIHACFVWVEDDELILIDRYTLTEVTR